MATTTHNPHTTTGPSYEWFSRHVIELSWRSILAGVVSGLAIWVMLYTLGVAIGMTAIDPSAPNTLQTTGWFGGIWTLVAPIVALFIGGLVAGRGAGAVTRGEGALHGLVTWGLTILIGAWFVSNVVAGAVSIGTQLSQGMPNPGALGLDMSTQVQALDAAARFFWSLFGSIALAMLAALAGGALGVSKSQRYEAKNGAVSERVVDRDYPGREAHV